MLHCCILSGLTQSPSADFDQKYVASDVPPFLATLGSTQKWRFVRPLFYSTERTMGGDFVSNDWQILLHLDSEIL